MFIKIKTTCNRAKLNKIKKSKEITYLYNKDF